MTKNIDYFEAKYTQALNGGTFSNTTVEQSMDNESIIKEAYERIGIVSDLLTTQQINSALRSMNLILSSWLNKGLRQWMVRRMFVSLVPGQSEYKLIDQNGNQFVREILGINLFSVNLNTREINRRGENVLTGVPSSNQGGTAGNAFDLNNSTACTQVNINGSITFLYNPNINPILNLIGIVSNTDKYYSLKFTIPSTNPFDVPVELLRYKGNFPANRTVWLNPLNQLNVRNPLSITLEETEGGTLDLQEIYYARSTGTSILTPTSRDTFFQVNNVSAAWSNPYMYFFDKQISPSLYINSPLNNFRANSLSVLEITYMSALMDVGSLQNVPEVPPLFYDALMAELACRLALKEGKMDVLQYLKQEAEDLYESARSQDTEGVSISVYSTWDY